MKNIMKFLLATALISATISCNKDDDPVVNPNITFLATINGASEVPANASPFTGNATLTYNTTTKIFSIVVTHNVVAPTNGHIHVGAPGVSGPVVFPFGSFTSPISYTSPALTAVQESDLMLNMYYVNIHTAAFPGGEIRGQLIKQ